MTNQLWQSLHYANRTYIQAYYRREQGRGGYRRVTDEGGSGGRRRR
jgi:hypothetical protein